MKRIFTALCILALTAAQGVFAADAATSKAQAAIADAAKKIQEEPADSDAINVYMRACIQQFNALVKSDRKAAQRLINDMKETFRAVKTKDEKAANLLPRAVAHLTKMESGIETAQKRDAMIGKDAAPLNLEEWVNGAPLSNDDLKGKVVLLDFWAVWCGPCIATFPHLREWREEFSKDGLVIIGLTRPDNYTWDDAKKRASRSKEKLTTEQRHEMLGKFAEHHKLEHPFAIQPDRKLSQYYHVSGIPHVVIIDRKGKIRLMKVGSGPDSAKAIEAMIKKLIKEDA
ncbi:MAG: thiol-disulfide isomerase/thioredoxin [Candidatus Binatia bacterium]|jgi:thiol-disulfide isomerase/thioredoxin